MRMTDSEVMEALRSDSTLNRARAVFSAQCGRIDQAYQQKSITPIELRRLEFEAVQNIAIALGVKL